MNNGHNNTLRSSRVRRTISSGSVSTRQSMIAEICVVSSSAGRNLRGPEQTNSN